MKKVVKASEQSTYLEVIQKTDSKPCSTTEALHVRTNSVGIRKLGNRKKKISTPSKTKKTPAKRRRLPCLFCKLENHSSAECRKVKDLETRKQKLKGRCLHCLRRNHTTEECRKKISCFRCKGDHLQIFCPGTNSKNSSVKYCDVNAACEMSNSNSFLQTAVAKIKNPNSNNTVGARLLLDSGSQFV